MKRFIQKQKTRLTSRSIPYGIEDLLLFGDKYCAVGLPWKSPPRLIKNVTAGIKAYFGGYSSIDYFLKKYGNDWNYDEILNSEEKLVFELTDFVQEIVRSELNNAVKIPDKPDRPALVAAGAAMLRLLNSFNATIFSIRQSYHFEAAQLQKLIIEQLSWVYSIYNITDDQYFNVLPSKCISNLKKIYPEAGNLYGILNELGHITPVASHRYIYLNEGELTISAGKVELSKYDAWNLLLLSDIYLIILEIIYHELIDEYRHIIVGEDGLLIINPNRPLIKKLEYYQEILFSNLPEE